MGKHLSFTTKLKYVIWALIKHEDIVKLGLTRNALMLVSKSYTWIY